MEVTITEFAWEPIMEDFERRREEILETYAEYRALARPWSDEAFEMARMQPRGNPVEFMARKMDMWEEDTIFLESEHEMNILRDFAIFGIPKYGERVVDRFIDRKMEEDDLAQRERQFLKTRRHDRFSIIEVVRPVFDFGIYFEDYLTGDELFVVDRNMSRTIEPGNLLATRLIKVDDWYVMTGAGFFVDERIVHALPRHLRRLFREKGDRPEEIPPLARRKFEVILFEHASRRGLTRQIRTEQ